MEALVDFVAFKSTINEGCCCLVVVVLSLPSVFSASALFHRFIDFVTVDIRLTAGNDVSLEMCPSMDLGFKFSLPGKRGLVEVGVNNVLSQSIAVSWEKIACG